jgi:hypothetical protein
VEISEIVKIFFFFSSSLSLSISALFSYFSQANNNSIMLSLYQKFLKPLRAFSLQRNITQNRQLSRRFCDNNQETGTKTIKHALVRGVVVTSVSAVAFMVSSFTVGFLMPCIVVPVEMGMSYGEKFRYKVKEVLQPKSSPPPLPAVRK